MLNARWRSILWSVVFILLMLSIITPLSVITISLIMIPLLIMYVTLNVKSFVVHLLISLGIILLLTGQLGFFLLLMSLFFLVPVIVMGRLYKAGSAAHVVIAAGVISILVEILAIFLLFAAAGINLVSETTQILQESYRNLPDILRQDLSEDSYNQAIFTLSQMIPLYMIGFSLFYSVFTHSIGRNLLNRMGYSIAGLRPIKEWMVPKSLVWYYVIALLLSYIIEPELDSMLVMLLVNLIPVLMFVFCVQAISFLFYLADIKKWNKAFPILGIVACIFFPSFMSLLGVFDVMFQVRKNFQKQ